METTTTIDHKLMNERLPSLITSKEIPDGDRTPTGKHLSSPIAVTHGKDRRNSLRGHGLPPIYTSPRSTNDTQLQPANAQAKNRPSTSHDLKRSNYQTP